MHFSIVGALAPANGIDMTRRLVRAARAWQASSVTRRISGVALMLVGATLVIRSVTAGRELVVAYHFGTSDALDAFIVAFVVPSFVIGVVVGSFTSALLPTFVTVRDSEGHEAARRLAANALSGAIVLLLVILAALWVASPFLLRLLGSGFPPEKLALAVELQRLMLPVILLHGAVKFWGTLLHAGERFRLVGLTPVTTPLITVVLVLLFGAWGGVHILAAGLLAGYAIEACIVVTFAVRRGMPLVPRWHGFDSPTRTVLQQYLPLTLGALMGSGTILVDQSMAAMLGSGSVASLTYGNKLTALILAFTAHPISVALLPYLSRQIASARIGEARRSVAGWMALAVLVTIPLSYTVFLFSDVIVRIVFERGAFTAEDTRLVGAVQAMYCLQIPFYLVGIIGSRMLSALRLNHILAIVGTLSFTSNIFLNLLFMKFFGLPGIALSTSLVYFLTATFIVSCLLHRLRRRSAPNAKLGGA